MGVENLNIIDAILYYFKMGFIYEIITILNKNNLKYGN